jgi:hypothetical protein
MALSHLRLFGDGPSCACAPPVVAPVGCVQTGAITIPKSSSARRIEQNAEVFGWEIGEELMAEIAETCDEGFKASGSVNAQDEPWSDVK